MIIAVTGERSTTKGVMAHALDDEDVDDRRLPRLRRAWLADLRDRVDLDDVELEGVGEDVPRTWSALRVVCAPSSSASISPRSALMCRGRTSTASAAPMRSARCRRQDALVARARARESSGRDVLAVPLLVAVGDGHRAAGPSGPVGDERRAAVELVAERDRRRRTSSKRPLARAGTRSVQRTR
jgi:hypothetical protein